MSHTPQIRLAARSAKKETSDYRRNPAFQQLLKSVYDGVAICDRDGVIRDTNERLRLFLDRAADRIHGRPVTDFLSGASPDLLTNIERGLADRRHVLLQAYARRRNNSLFPVEISVNHLEVDQTYLCFFFRDITVRKQTEDRLRTGHNAINNCLSGIAVADPMGIIVYANPAALRLWGCTSEKDLHGQSILNLWQDRTRARHMLDMIMDADREWNGDLVALGRDGRTTALHVAAACNLDNDDEVTGMVFSFIDISDRLRADAAVRQAETREAMLASLAAACHHLGQPATVLLTSMEMLKRKLQHPDSDTHLLLESAHDAAVKLAEVLGKLATTSEYRTTDYLLGSKSDSPFNKILDIE